MYSVCIPAGWLLSMASSPSGHIARFGMPHRRYALPQKRPNRINHCLVLYLQCGHFTSLTSLNNHTVCAATLSLNNGHWTYLYSGMCVYSKGCLTSKLTRIYHHINPQMGNNEDGVSTWNIQNCMSSGFAAFANPEG